MLKRRLLFLLSCSLAIVSALAGYARAADPAMTASAGEAAPVAAPPGQFDQLVAPIALYPDPLVAQILAASTQPAQIVEADRWLQQHSGLRGQSLAQEIDKQPWDPSVKALTEFPEVLANMDRNLSWTSALGDAYVNERPQVFGAIQAMRQRAQQAGHLQGTPQETVTATGQEISIEPEYPGEVYVPEYDPWLAYGTPMDAYPGWDPYPGLFLDGPGIDFGLGIGVGLLGFGWGWPAWGADWHHHRLVFHHHDYNNAGGKAIVQRGVDHADFGHGEVVRGTIARSYAAPHVQPAIHSGPYGGLDRGGMARPYSFRGQPNIGVGRSFGTGFHGGGFQGGGFGGGGFQGGGGGRR